MNMTAGVRSPPPLVSDSVSASEELGPRSSSTSPQPRNTRAPARSTAAPASALASTISGGTNP